LVYETGDGGVGADFNADGLMSYAVDDEFGAGAEPSVRVINPATGELIQTFPTDLDIVLFTSWSPDETRIAAANQQEVIVFDVATGAEISRTGDGGRLFEPKWLPDGDAFVVGGELNPRVIDAATAEVRTVLFGLTGGTWHYEVVPGTTLLAAAGLGGSDTVIFDTSQLGRVEVGGWLAPFDSNTVDYVGDGDRVVVSNYGSYINARALDGGEPKFTEGVYQNSRLELNTDAGLVASMKPDGIWGIRVADTGEVIYRAPAGWNIAGVSPDGTRALITEARAEECVPRVVSTADGSLIADLPDGDCFRAFFSPDGNLVHTGSNVADAQALFDTASGELQGTPLEWPKMGWEAAFTPDSSKLVLGTWEGIVYIFDVAALLAGTPADEAIIRQIPAHDTGVLRVKMSPDGSMAATWGWTEPFKVWDLDTGQLLGQFGGVIDDGLFHGGDFHPSLPQLIVTSPPNEVRVYTLDIDELIAIARSKLSRGMTDTECQQYFREPCPTS
jgi:WD40 repeat protein